MPLAIPEITIGLILMTLVTVAVLYWTILQLQGRLSALPIVGGAIVDALNALNSAMISAARAILDGLISLTIDAIKAVQAFLATVVNLIVGPLASTVTLVRRDVDSILTAFNTYVNADLASLRHDVDSILNAFSTYVNATLAKLTLDVNSILHAFESYVNPALASLRHDVDNILGVFAVGVNATLAYLTAEVVSIEKLVIPGVQADIRELDHLFNLLVTKPITGLLDRVQGLERLFEKGLPLAILASLSIPLVQTLVKVAEDPCYCVTQGSGQDLTWYAYAEALDLT